MPLETDRGNAIDLAATQPLHDGDLWIKIRSGKTTGTTFFASYQVF